MEDIDSGDFGISGSNFYSANSAKYCNATTKDCRCTTANELCTGRKICSKDDTCEGKQKLDSYSQ